MNARIHHDYVVAVNIQAKKNKSDSQIKDLYLLFEIKGSELLQATTLFSLGISIPSGQWGGTRIGMRGVTNRAVELNDVLTKHKTKAVNMLERLSEADTITPQLIVQKVQTDVRTSITGNPARGKKADVYLMKSNLTLEAVVEEKKTMLSLSRQNLCNSVFSLFKTFMGGNVPLLTNINVEHLIAFKVWLTAPENEYSVETHATYLGLLKSFFKIAVKTGRIKVSPVPEGYAPFVKDEDRTIPFIIPLVDRKALYSVPEEELSHELQVAKHCMAFQLTTGMAYCDIETLGRIHLKFHKDQQVWEITKRRKKTRKSFAVQLTPRAKYCIDRLVELTAGKDLLFLLPKLRKMNKYYGELATKAQMERFTSYDLRHTFAVDYMDCGGKIDELALILGHTKLETTRIYGRVSKERKNQRMKQLEERSFMHQL